MKPIIKPVLFTAFLALLITGCQKSTYDSNLQAELKGSINGIEPVGVGSPTEECAAAGYNCGYAFKIEPWDEFTGVGDNVVYNADDGVPGGNVITIVTSDGHNFTWTSNYPVCAVIVKAGKNSTVYPVNGAKSGSVNDIDKVISHITFCYSKEIVLAVKCTYKRGFDYRVPYTLSFCASGGDGAVYPFSGCTENEWCKTMGYNTYPEVNTFPLVDKYYPETVGTVTMLEGTGSLQVTITLKSDGLINEIWLYSGLTIPESATTCPDYHTNDWQHIPNGLIDNTVTFIIPY